jgi:squalene-associated FAD-dependent desaturase
VYLPLAELRACGYSEEDLRAGVVDARYLKLMAAQIERAERFYSGGAELTRWLEPCGRRIFGWMTASYHRLLRKIADRPGRVFRERVRLGRGEAVFLGLRWMLWPGKMSKEEGGKGKKEGGAIRETRGGMRSVGIVGGGLAGWAAAVAAVDRGFRVEVFEQATTLGGRAGSFVDSVTGETIDYCQHVAMGCCSAFLDFCGRTGIDVCLERTSRLHFIASDGKRVDFAPNNWLPAPLHLLPGLMGLKFLSLGERLGIVRALGTLLRERMSERQTMGDWLRRHGQSEGAVERFWSVVVVSALGETVDRASSAAARQVFADGFLASRGASDLVLLRAPLGEIFGDRLGRWLDEHGVAVHLKTRVSRLEGNTEGIRELVLCDGSRRSFDAVVVAAPWHGVRSLMGEGLWAALPELHGVERIEPAAITAVHLWFDRPVISLTHAALIGRLGQWVFCRPLAGAAGCYCQVVVSASHRLAKRKHDAWIAEVCRELTAIGADGRPAARLLHARVVTQPKAIFSVQPGVERFRPGPATAIGNLFLAGDWTDTRWPSTMEGAVRSGRRAVDAIERWFRMVTG